MSFLVVIPTYNEAENITGIVRAVLALEPRMDVLVVDDGSPDGTGDLVEKLAQEVAGSGPRAEPRIHLLRRAGKLGLGTAYIEGFRFALSRGYEAVCEMDADWSHNPDDLPLLLAPVANNEADLVIGSRYIGGVRIMNWPLSRLILSWSAGVYTRAITRLPVHDVTAGFKCIHRRVLERLDLGRIRSNGYSFQIEVNYRAWTAGFRLREVPIVFTERTEGTSKMSKNIVREAAWKVWELRLRHMFGRL